MGFLLPQADTTQCLHCARAGDADRGLCTVLLLLAGVAFGWLITEHLKREDPALSNRANGSLREEAFLFSFESPVLSLFLIVRCLHPSTFAFLRRPLFIWQTRPVHRAALAVLVDSLLPVAKGRPLPLKSAGSGYASSSHSISISITSPLLSVMVATTEPTSYAM